jgi:hypothetical protein
LKTSLKDGKTETRLRLRSTQEKDH